MKLKHELLTAIQQRIDAHEEIMNDYAIDYIEAGTLIHHNIYEDYHHRKKVVLGLKEALSIVNDILAYPVQTTENIQMSRTISRSELNRRLAERASQNMQEWGLPQ